MCAGHVHALGWRYGGQTCASILFEEYTQDDAVIVENHLTIEEIIDADQHEVVLPDPAGCPPGRRAR